MTADEILVFASQLSPILMVCLILLGIGLLALEFFVVSFGLLAAAGLACVVLGLAALLQTFGGPGSDTTATVALGRSVTYVFAAVTAGVVGVIGWLVIQAQRRARQRYGQSHTRSNPDGGLLPSETHCAEVTEPIQRDQAGKIFYRGALWTAKWAPEELGHDREPSLPCAPGSLVEVVRWEGLVALVRGVNPQDPSRPVSSTRRNPSHIRHEPKTH